MMAAIHVMDGNGNGLVNLVFHFTVPNVNNRVAVNFRTALANSGRATTVMTEGAGAGQITTAEKVQVESGEKFEHACRFRPDSGGSTNAELLTQVRALYAARDTSVLAAVAKDLDLFGYTATAT